VNNEKKIGFWAQMCAEKDSQGILGLPFVFSYAG
jgi:hypothetical protein